MAGVVLAFPWFFLVREDLDRKNLVVVGVVFNFGPTVHAAGVHERGVRVCSRVLSCAGERAQQFERGGTILPIPCCRKI